MTALAIGGVLIAVYSLVIAARMGTVLVWMSERLRTLESRLDDLESRTP